MRNEKGTGWGDVKDHREDGDEMQLELRRAGRPRLRQILNGNAEYFGSREVKVFTTW